jgi:hypothetical protein
MADMSSQIPSGKPRSGAHPDNGVNNRWQSKMPQFNRVDDVLNSVVNHLGLDKRLREHTLINLWPTLISQFFSDRSRALFVDNEGTLVIAVKDASTGQELTLLSPQLTPKLKQLAANLNLAVKGLRFELKHFHQKQACEFVLADDPPPLPKPSDNELFALSLSKDDQNKIDQLKVDLASSATAGRLDSQINNVLTNEMQERIIGLFEKQLRLAQWKKEHNYPLCGRCHETAARLHTTNNLCDLCYFDSLSQAKANLNVSNVT